ncbi:MAG: hypothetical protein GEV11_17930, partial [Streptosporangiales bacterium]|nr:hypothetical protein [Streptosporangiales bacterium]
MRTPTLREIDVIAGALLALLGAFVAIQGIGLGFYAGDVPGAGFFPTVLAVLLIIAGISLAVTRLRAARTEDAEDAEDAE